MAGAEVQNTDTSGGTGELGGVLLWLVGVAAGFGITAGADVGNGFVHDLVWDMEARVAGCPKSHDLHDRGGNIRIVGSGEVAPSTLGILALQDEQDSPFQNGADGIIQGLSACAPELAQGQCGHAVAVHVATMGAARTHQAAIDRIGRGGQKARRLQNGFTMLAPAWQMAIGEKSEYSKGTNGGAVTVLGIAPGSIGLLLGS